MSNLAKSNSCTSLEGIEHHYNIGNDFYRLLLGETMTYSGGLWSQDGVGDSLEAAQTRKMDFHIEQARAKGAQHVLDLGCGWGWGLKRLVNAGAQNIVGLTLSSYQQEWIKTLELPRTQVLLQSWEDHVPQQPYDAIISIGAFEHFARMEASVPEKIEGYRKFFAQCREWLKPGGWMSLQTIACGNMRPEDYHGFVAQDIFPETALPRLAEIAEAAEGTFQIMNLHNDAAGYVLTLKAWLKSFRQNRDQAVKIVGEDLVSRYERYLKITLLAFEIGANQLLRVTLKRIDKK